MKRGKLVTSVLYRLGLPRLLDAFWGARRITVLAYHRIANAAAPDFQHYRPNVSASPEMFARQMEFVAKRFNVIDLSLLIAFIQKGRPLPPRPLLITFDDGYLDNYTNAYPILLRLGLPAVIFLMTSRMDDPTALAWWDECAYYFEHTEKTSATLPLIGAQDMSTPEQRAAVRERLMREMKKVPELQKQAALHDLSRALAVAPPHSETPVFLNWDQVRELVNNGISCQPHTVNHPILTRIAEDEAHREIAESKARIEEQTGKPVTAFAYPNGTLADYDAAAFRALYENGYTAAFTLTPGPVRPAVVHRYPYQIPRVFLIYHDTFEVFVMKTMGLPALTSQRRFLSEID